MRRKKNSARRGKRAKKSYVTNGRRYRSSHIRYIIFYIYNNVIAGACMSLGQDGGKKYKDIFPIVSVNNNNNIYYIEIKPNESWRGKKKKKMFFFVFLP